MESDSNSLKETLIILKKPLVDHKYNQRYLASLENDVFKCEIEMLNM